MLQLFLLRHAKAAGAPAGHGDFDRPLAEEGRAAAQALGLEMRRRNFAFDLVLCSAARRTRATCQALALPSSCEVREEGDLYLASASALRARLQALAAPTSRVLLIGHNPGLEELGLELLVAAPNGERQRLERGLATCALLHFEIAGTDWSALGRAAAKLATFLEGSELRR